MYVFAVLQNIGAVNRWDYERTFVTSRYLTRAGNA